VTCVEKTRARDAARRALMRKARSRNAVKYAARENRRSMDQSISGNPSLNIKVWNTASLSEIIQLLRYRNFTQNYYINAVTYLLSLSALICRRRVISYQLM